jgi:hypothetical protein
LEANFRRQNELDDANEAYFQMKVAELQEAKTSWQKSWRGFWFWQKFWQDPRASWEQLWNSWWEFRQDAVPWSEGLERLLWWLGLEALWLVWGATCGYGTGLWLILGWTLVVNLGCTLLYSTCGTLQRRYHPEISEDFTFKPRLWDLPHSYVTPQAPTTAAMAVSDGEAWEASKARLSETTSGSGTANDPLRTLLTAFRFSSVVLCKVGPRDTTVSGRIGKCDLRWIVRVEWVLGFYLWTLLIYTLTNTQPLLNKLIEGVF